jgi:pyruvate-ferredoxin/flavodoxin oxidoreductase
MQPVVRPGHLPAVQRPRMTLASYTRGELRFRALANTDPAEAERLALLAQQAVDQRWDTYEEMASRAPARFPADARKAQGKD